MTKALTTGFDTSKIVNRVAQRLVLDAPHPLLAGRIEWNKDRLGGSNPHLLTAKTVADIVRTTCVYPVGVHAEVPETLDLVGLGDRRTQASRWPSGRFRRQPP